MKTILFTLEYPPFFGGVANYYGNLVKHWPDQDGLCVLDNANSRLINEKLPMFKWLPAVRELYRAVKYDNVAEVIVGQVLPLGTVAYYLQKILHFKYTVVLHGTDLAYAMKVSNKKKLAKKILNKADTIICTNTYVAKMAADFLGVEAARRISVVNPGVNSADAAARDEAMITALRKQYDLDGKFVLLTIARLVKRKGVDQVIMALTRLVDRLPNLAYVIIGDGPDKDYIKNYAASLDNHFQGHLKFISSVDDSAKWQWLYLCNCLIMPGRDEGGDVEGFGIAYLEAGLAGKPVIAGLSGGVGDAVEQRVNGLLIDPKDADKIAEAITEIMDNQELARELGQRGKQRAEREFIWKNQVERFYQYINR